MLLTVSLVYTSINRLALGIYPVLFRFLQGLLNPLSGFYVFFRPFFFIRIFFKSLLSSQRSRTSLVTQGFFLRHSFPSIPLAVSVTAVMYAFYVYLRILCEKYLQQHQNFYLVFSIWQSMACSLMGHHAEILYINANLVQMNGSTGEWFGTTVGVGQGCLLSPTLFNIFLERIMSDALEPFPGSLITFTLAVFELSRTCDL